MVEMNFQGFRIIGPDFKKCYGVAQFMFLGYEVSASEMGRDKGACLTPVAVFKDDACAGEFRTVEDAILWINLQTSTILKIEE